MENKTFYPNLVDEKKNEIENIDNQEIELTAKQSNVNIEKIRKFDLLNDLRENYQNSDDFVEFKISNNSSEEYDSETMSTKSTEEEKNLIESYNHKKEDDIFLNISKNKKGFGIYTEDDSPSIKNENLNTQISSSNHSNSLNIEFTNFIDTNNKSYFTYECLSKRKSIIELFYLFDLIILTDEFRLKKNGCINKIFYFKKNYIPENEFPGLGFLSFKALTLIKKDIAIHNKNLQDSEVENNRTKNYTYQICFDEGDFYKNMVYKKLQIHDKYLFVPFSKYQLKLTEYKLRSFCQIMEELGAIEIEIDFNHISLEKKSKNLTLQAEEFNYIASSLGFSASKTSSNNEEITYKLTYPHNNTLVLNEKNIIKKIEKGKFIINKKTFDSNLELQFIITSRCRHFIENYSTVFTLDNSINYDKKMISKLKSHNFNCGLEYESKTLKKLKISINTKVKFCSQKDIGNNLLGNNVSYDSTGFNYLMCSIDNDKFDEIGIFKIISFIDNYIDKILKKDKTNYYKIKKLYSVINKEFSFQEYKELLLDYFNVDSQWINFLNFINVLKFRSVSYNKLGFLILMSQENLPVYERNLKIIDFIRHLCEKNNIEDQFWEMLEPNDYFLIVYKLDKVYNLLRKYNWFNVQKLLRDTKKYIPNIKESFNTTKINCETFYENLFTNFKLGHHQLQFERNLKPFLYKFIHANFNDRIQKIKQMSNNELLFINQIFITLQSRHFIQYDLNSLDKLNGKLNQKFNQLEESCNFYLEILNKSEKDFNCKNTSISFFFNSNLPDCNKNMTEIFFNILKSVLTKDTFKVQYPYLFKKFSHILDENDNLKICRISKEEDHNINLIDSEISSLVEISIKNSFDVKKICLNIVKRLLVYDINLANFEITRANLTNTFYNYLNEYVRNFDENKICFIKVKFFLSLANFIINQNFRPDFKKEDFYASEIVKINENKFINFYDLSRNGDVSEKTIDLIKNIIECYTYRYLVELILSFIKTELNLEIRADVINLLS